MILVLDNFDSFTFNLVQLLRATGEGVTVWRNEGLTAQRVLDAGARAVVVSPGPGTPEAAGVSVDLFRFATLPVLGVCLGHQALAVAFGAKVVRAPRAVHGEAHRVLHGGEGLFHGLPSPFEAARYHSLTVEPASLPEELELTARTETGVVMGLRHRQRPLVGVQFHPESVLSPQGPALVANFLAGRW